MDFVWEKIKIVKGQPSERIVILARNLRYGVEWCRVHQINPASPRVKIVTRISDLFGNSDVWYVDLGTDDEALRNTFEMMKVCSSKFKPLLEEG